MRIVRLDEWYIEKIVVLPVVVLSPFTLTSGWNYQSLGHGHNFYLVYDRLCRELEVNICVEPFRADDHMLEEYQGFIHYRLTPFVYHNHKDFAGR